MGVAEWLRKCCAHPIRFDGASCNFNPQSMGPVSANRLDHTGFGFVAGLLGTGIGFAAMTVWWSWANGTSFDYFIQDVFMGSALYKDSILTISVLFNVGVFWMALRADWDRFARGVLGVIFITVPLIIWLQAQAF